MQLKTFIENCVKDVAAYYTNNNERGTLYRRLPIKKIDGIPVDVLFHFNNHMNHKSPKDIWMCLYVTTSKIQVTMDGATDDMTLFNTMISKDCEKMNIDVESEKVKTILETLKFNKFVGEFNPKQQTTEMIDQFDEMENIETSYDSCCVCQEATMTETPCGHQLCMCCWLSLKKMKCPICRASIKYIDNDEDDEDDE